MADDLGGVRIARIADGSSQAFDFTAMLLDATRPQIERAASILGARFFAPETLALQIAFNGYLVRTPEHNILVDTCIGDDKRRPTRPGWDHRHDGSFIHALAQAGVTPDDIDIVMCTHLHADHVGWNTKLENGRWVPTFPNARYLMGRIEYEHWLATAASIAPEELLYGSFADSVLPVVAHHRADFVEDGHHVNDRVRLELIPGHTPGNLIIHVEGSAGHTVLAGDVLHHPVQLLYPDWSTRFCTDPDLSRTNRRAFLDRFADTPTLICPAHFISPTVGRIKRAAAKGEPASYTFEFAEL